jgi:Zn-dependent protease with chaperone function
LTFFEHQSLARRNSRVMVALFLLAVAAIVVTVDLVVGVIYLLAGDVPVDAGLAGVPRGVFTLGALATIAIIAVVSLWNIVGLAGGGAKVARMLGGRKVTLDTREPLERRFVNIVEEMAIASGVRVPEAWVIDDEPGINAFSAGWTVSGAVVGVTRGTLERLTRDELQGVIGHEFSHILNGDMGLNIRMIGVLAGIVAIGSIGGFIMRGAFEGADDIRAALFLFFVGLIVFTIGYTGLFFARLIKASVSRQREFLADASSVQFTRNPDGIAGALDQIRASGAGTLIQGRYAEEMSHMFFGQSVKMRFGGLFETHPPLEERIRRVNPGFQLSAYRGRRAAEPSATGTPAEAAAIIMRSQGSLPRGRHRRGAGRQRHCHRSPSGAICQEGAEPWTTSPIPPNRRRNAAGWNRSSGSTPETRTSLRNSARNAGGRQTTRGWWPGSGRSATGTRSTRRRNSAAITHARTVRGRACPDDYRRCR